MHKIEEHKELQQRLSQITNRTIDEKRAELLLSHLRFVLEKNRDINLTSIKDEEQGIALHIEDSLTALKEIDEAIPGKLVDLGSGGGFPGIPLAIVTERKTSLIEGKRKKAKILKEFIDITGLNNQICVEARRIEEISKMQKEYYAVATARALSSLAVIMELAAPLIEMNGSLIAYKAKISESELEEAKKIEKLLGMELSSIRDLVLSDKETKRKIIVFKKVDTIKISLPRRDGLAQNNPL